jgi:hypothetical protein
MHAQYAQANIDYSNALKAGVENEFALAAVKVFKVIPCNVSDPLIIDLNGNGIFDVTPIYEGVNFDMFGVQPQAIAWLKGDGFLFLDRNSNHIADNGTEFFGDPLKFKDGFEHLRVYDNNRDGFLSEEDPAYDYIRIWNDFDGNGKCEVHETTSLKEYGIWGLTLNKKDCSIMTPGGEVKYVAEALNANFNSILVGDIYLRSGIYARLD